MRALPSAAPSHVVKLQRSDIIIEIELRPLPLGFQAMVEAKFPPPKVSINGRPPEPDPDQQADYNDLRMCIALAASITGDYAIEATRPEPKANRAAWEGYARAVRDELNAAGFVSGDILAILEGFKAVNEGHGLGKASSSATTE